MKTMTLLLVLAAVMLLSPSFVKSSGHKPQHNLNQIIDLAQKYNESRMKETFVEDVSYLSEGSDKCGDKFFCQVEKILESHVKIHGRRHKRNAEMAILKNLNLYIKSTHVNCNETLKDVTPSDETKKLLELVGYLSLCAKHVNLNDA